MLPIDPTNKLSLNRRITEGDLVVVYERYDSMKPVKVTENGVLQNRFGVFKHSDWIGKSFGSKVFSSKGGFVYLLAPTPELWTLVLSHRTQILYIADISFVVMYLEVVPGCVVLEEDFERTGLSSLVTVGVRDIQGEGFPDEFLGRADSVFLDLPQPWLAIPSASKVLQQDGVLCSFSPCIEQVQRSCETLKSNFTDIRTFEVLLHAYEVREGNLGSWQDSDGGSLKSSKKRQRSANGLENSKPKTIMARRNGETRGHTGYLTFARLKCSM
ncbi:tRNA (adenine(58)-N(1))-methyltransferase catalytic subunit TRMT61A [Sesamum alatum]|uniref:tRNA (adenine(58)-N(1))-methyltransferase n=1 Tax=Sesamum alatum TaxID=300844 RepID=A0AAE1XTQ1_9LAMI|nr:tRNA (adenine(58)-N(1))-methyltransferase catalytic subunit TRMT61A [Sesamum alatum]